ncbi:MAG: sensor histidine kinase [Planctomycetota bacterium]|jgi:signal transduction histidine kinase
MALGLRRRYRKSLRWKILVPIWFGLTLLVAVLSVFSSNRVQQTLYDTARRATEAHARQLAVFAAEACCGKVVDEQLRHAFQELLNSEPTTLGLAAYSITADHTRLEMLDARYSLSTVDILFPKVLDPLDIRDSGEDTHRDGHHLYVATSMATLDNMPTGAIRVASTFQSAAEQVARYRLWIALLGLILLVLAAVAAHRLVDNILLTLTSVQGAMERAMEGHLEHRVMVEAEDELGQLAGHFNRMAERVQETQEEIRRHAGLLEQRVQERTQELQAAYEDLRSLERAKDGFLSSLSHEMRTPLTSIIAAEEILSDYADDNQEAREEFLAIVHQESQNLLAMINQLLDVAKLEAQALRLDLAHVDMRALLREVCSEASKRAKDQGVKLRTFLPKTDVVCVCDRDRIKRVVQTLVHNALRFSTASQVIRVMLKTDETAMVVQVIDEAPPSDEDVRLEAVSNVPRGGDIISTTSTGFALGLPISIRLVNAHGGKLQGYRTANTTNVFTVLLPLTQEAAAAT